MGPGSRWSRYGEPMPQVSQIRESFRAFEPDWVDLEVANRAAVAVVLRELRQGPEILFIERATRSGDPWSGHMAFPGGRLEAVDSTPRAAAERETLEEVGLSLEGAEYIGGLGDIQGHRRFGQNQLVVSAHVYLATDPGPVSLQASEVRSTIWFPVRGLLDRQRHVAYRSPQAENMEFPGVLVGEPQRHVVWGLTYRFLELFMGAIEYPLPDRSDEFDLSAYTRP